MSAGLLKAILGTKGTVRARDEHPKAGVGDKRRLFPVGCKPVLGSGQLCDTG
jgi:hypothetical protein